MAGEIFLAEQLSVANAADVLLLIGAHVVAARTEVVRELNVTGRSEREKSAGWVTSSMAQALTASGLVDAATSGAQDDCGRAVREGENGASSKGAQGMGSISWKQWPQRGQFSSAKRC